MFRLTRKKPLRRKRIATRSVFKAHGDNPLKTYRRRYTDYAVMVRAEICRQDRLRNRTRAEMAFAELLDGMKVQYEIEKIFLNGDPGFWLISMSKRRKLYLRSMALPIACKRSTTPAATHGC